MEHNEELVAYTPAQLAEAEFPMAAMRQYTGSDGDEHFEVVTIESFAKGWASVVASNGDKAKCRAADLYPLEEGATEEGGRMAKILAKYRAQYVPSVAASGKKSLHNGDLVAKALEYRELEWLYNTAADILEFDVQELKARYSHLNFGSQRMNLGNRIRAAYKRGDEKVVAWVESQNEQA